MTATATDLVRRRRFRTAPALACVVVLLLVLVAGPVGAADDTSTTIAATTEPTTDPAADTTADTTAPAPVDAGIGDLDAGSNTPSPRGEAEPPRAQRVADSAIAAGLLVVLAAGVIIAVWTGRRRSSSGTDDPVVGAAARAVGSAAMTTRTSPLDSAHRALGAKMVPFGGWDMPLAYGSGTLAEHHACRHGAVAFDVSHLGTVRVQGPDALASLQRSLTNDLGKIEPGRAQYTHLLDPDDASVLDDIIVWWIAPDVFDVMPNASNTDRVTGALAEGAGDVSIADVTASRAIIAVQGPEARERLATVSPAAAAVGRFRVAPFEWNGVAATVAGTGYTGEDGVECAVPAEHAEAFWDAVLAAGVEPAGLGARDTLRLEAALPLHGHELGPGITSLQAGLGWVVSWDKGEFRGRDALLAERDAGVARRLFGLAVDGRRPPRAEQDVLVGGATVGVVTSGNFSPELGHGIGLAFLPPTTQIGDVVEIDARGTAMPATVVPTPFVAKS